MPRDELDAPSTEELSTAAAAPRRLRVVVVAGPDRGRRLDLRRGSYRVGKEPGCDLTLTDGAVSREHLELTVEGDGLAVRDLGSRNGSHYKGARFDAIQVGPGAVIVIGRTELRVEAVAPAGPPQAATDRFGELVGVSPPMQRLFELLQRVAPTPASVLIQGETGTGKELVARALHDASPRRDRPFAVCDLGGLPASLIESELYGHVRGAFTGAERDRAGSFEAAEGGTVFLDEVGELEPAVQPRLLRALESRQVKRLGSGTWTAIDVRVIAATNRDLAAEVRAGRFREDLYHRLAVVVVNVPPLRERPGDVPVLVDHILGAAAAAAGRPPPEVPAETMAALAAYDWPGNVRELRNVLERALAIAPDGRAVEAERLGLAPATTTGAADAPVDASMPFHDAKERLVDAWEREYVQALLERCGGNVSEAARQGGINRPYLHRLLKKHGLG